MRLSVSLQFVSWIGLSLAGCKPSEPTPPPEPVVQAPEPEPEPGPPPKVPEDAIAVGTFNVKWAFDNLEDRRPRQARNQVAKTDEDWLWKRDAIAKILIEERLHVVALEEIGGERELGDIAMKIRADGGFDYHWAIVPSEDKHTGQHVGLLSVFPLSNERHLSAKMTKQMAAELTLPTGEEVTVVAVHARTGQYPAYQAERRKQARSVKFFVNRIAKQHPVIVLGTFNSVVLPHHDDYAKRSPGIFAGANTSNEGDDCMDSADFGPAQATSVDDVPLDRIFTCGLEMRDATASSQDAIVRGTPDPGDAPWAAIPIEEEPQRDVSDHYVVWAEVALPKPPAEEAPEEGDAPQSEVGG